MDITNDAILVKYLQFPSMMYIDCCSLVDKGGIEAAEIKESSQKSYMMGAGHEVGMLYLTLKMCAEFIYQYV